MKHAKALVASHYSQKSNIPLNITLGNVSGDADSTIGAVLLGYAMTHKNGFYPQEEEKLHENASKFYVPIVNFKREELRCRQDIEWHCEQRGFDKDLFIFFDEIDLGYYCEKELLNTTLFDHNSLDINEAYLGSSVKAIVDHHVDKGSHEGAERDIRVCGSACSMGFEYYYKHNLQHLLTSEVAFFFV